MQDRQDKILRKLKRQEFVFMYREEFEVLKECKLEYYQTISRNRGLFQFLYRRAFEYIGYSAKTYKYDIVYNLLRFYKIQLGL